MAGKLRICASCEWIFEDAKDCPKCGSAHYSAHSVYGNRAYAYKYTQQPWMDRQLELYQMQLEKEIAQTNQFTKSPHQTALLTDFFTKASE